VYLILVLMWCVMIVRHQWCRSYPPGVVLDPNIYRIMFANSAQFL